MTTFENVLIRSCPLSSHAQEEEDNSLTKFLEVIMLPGSTLSDDTKELISLMWHLSFPPPFLSTDNSPNTAEAFLWNDIRSINILPPLPPCQGLCFPISTQTYACSQKLNFFCLDGRHLDYTDYRVCESSRWVKPLDLHKMPVCQRLPAENSTYQAYTDSEPYLVFRENSMQTLSSNTL